MEKRKKMKQKMKNILQGGKILMLNWDPYYQNNCGNIWINTINESFSSNAPSTVCTPNTAVYTRVKTKLFFIKLVVSDFNEKGIWC